MAKRAVGRTGKMMDVTVEIHCAACGSANYSLPEGMADGAPVRCNDCGRTLARAQELQAEMVGQALARSAEVQRRDLRSVPGADGA